MKSLRREMDSRSQKGRGGWYKMFWTMISVNLLKIRNKWHKLWDGNFSREIRNGLCIISRDVLGNTYLLKVSCPLYNLYYIFLYQWTVLSNTTSLILCLLLRVLTSLSFTVLWCFLDKVQGFQGLLVVFLCLSTRKRYWNLFESEGPHWRFKFFL